nr:MAG TPA: hypothetical protein [Myoviridae sp. ctNhr24]
MCFIPFRLDRKKPRRQAKSSAANFRKKIFCASKTIDFIGLTLWYGQRQAKGINAKRITRNTRKHRPVFFKENNEQSEFPPRVVFL